MNFTIKELAELLNVSKGTISNHATKRNLKLNKNEHNIVLIQLEQSKQIAESINQLKSDKEKINIDDVFKEYETNEDIKEDTSKAEAQRNSNNDDLIEILKAQVQSLQKDKQDLTDLLKQQQQLLHNQQSLQLQSNEKIKALEIELNEVKEDVNRDTTDVSVNAEDVQRDVRNNKVDNFYKDLREDRSNKQSSFLSRLFKR